MVLADLPELLKASPGFHVSLNLSPQDLVADGPVQYLQRRFSAMEFPAGALMLEVTERGWWTSRPHGPRCRRRGRSA